MIQGGHFSKWLCCCPLVLVFWGLYMGAASCAEQQCQPIVKRRLLAKAVLLQTHAAQLSAVALQKGGLCAREPPVESLS